MYAFESSFWLKLLLLIVVVSLLLFLFNTLIRKWLGVEKPKAFSHNPVNSIHSKIDWIIRIFFIALILVGFFINTSRVTQEPYLFLESWFLLFVLIFVTEAVRAVMEWKYAANRKAYLATILQLAFSSLVVIVVIATDFFGIF